MDALPDEQRPRNLWRDPDFMKFWAAETLSLLGTQISFIAIPLLAVISLNATPFQMGVIYAAEFTPFLLVTLLVGVWVDKTRRLPLLIGANLGRAVVFGLIPLAVVLNMLNVATLGILVFLAAGLTVVFDLAYQSYLPSLIGRDHLIEGNGKLEGSRSFAQMTGPGAAGLLVAAVTAPIAILIDAVTYLVSAVTLLLVRRAEPAPQPEAGPRKSVVAQIGHGLRLAVKNTYLRALGIEAAIYNVFNQMLWAVLILHLVRGLRFSPAVVGIVLTMSGIGALLGSLVAGRLSRRWGLGPTLIVSIVIANAAPLVIPVAAGGSVPTAIMIGAALLINGVGLTVYSIQAISVRQAATTSDVLGRTNAGYRFAVTGAAAIGALLGGALGGWIGLRATILVGALGTLAAIWFVLRSPIPRLRKLSELAPDDGAMRTEPATPDELAATPSAGASS